MKTSTDIHDLSARNFVAQLHPTTAFLTASETIINLAEHNESFRKRVEAIKQQVSRNALNPFTLALIEGALDQGNPFETGSDFGPLKPLISAFYLRASAALQANGLPTNEQLIAYTNDSKRFNRLKSALEKGFVPNVELNANRFYHRVEAFRIKIDSAIGDIKSAYSLFDRQARKLNEVFESLEPQPQAAICIFNGKPINCVIFWILVIAILLVALIIDIFD
jgi:hypothetical protein